MSIDWGSFPDYLGSLALIGGGIGLWREYRKEQNIKQREREADREAKRLEILHRELSAALVVGSVTPPFMGDGRQTSLSVRFVNYSDSPVFDVEASVRYMGSAAIPASLELLQKQAAVLVPHESVNILIEASEWPRATYSDADFDWEVKFRDMYGNSWQRRRTGRPVRGDEHLLTEPDRAGPG